MFNSLKKAFLGMLFCYFVSMIVILGNGSSFLGRYFEPVFNPVANTIGLNTTWNFFSPDPAHIMYFKYFIFFENSVGETLKEPIEGVYPETNDFGLDKKRHSYAMRFMALDPSRVQNYFVPWICRKNPGSTKIQVELILSRIPPLDQVVAMVNTGIDTYENLVKTEEMNRFTFECPHAS